MSSPSKSKRSTGALGPQGDHMRLAQEAFKAGNYEKAVQEFHQCIMYLKQPKALLGRADAQRKLGLWTLALKDYGDVQKEFSIDVQRNPEFYDHVAICHCKVKKWELALEEHLTAIQLAERKGKYLYHRGVTYCEMENTHMYEQERYMRAIADFNRALDAYKDDPDSDHHDTSKVYFHRGLANRKLGKLEEAIDDCLKAKAHPDNHNNPAVHNNLGLAYFEMADQRPADFEKLMQQAVDSFSEAIRGAGAIAARSGNLNEDQKAYYYSNKGLANFRLGRFPQAQNDFSDAIHADTKEPLDPHLHLNLGKTFQAQKKFEEAQTEFDEAIQIDPTVPLFYHSKGWAYQEVKEYRKAAEQFLRAIQMQDNYVPSIYHLGLMCHSLLDYEQAISCFTRVLAIVPNDPRAYERRGIVLQDKNEHEKALLDFDRALAINPEYVSAYYNRGNTHLALGHHDLALADFDRALQLGAENDAFIYNVRAATYRAMKRHKEAIEDLTKALELDNTRVEFHFNRAQCYVEVKEYALAVSDLRQALTMAPNDPKIFYVRGLAFHGQKKFQKAIKDFRSALENGIDADTQPDSHFYMGLCYANMDSHVPAIEAYTRAMELGRQLGKLSVEYIHERAKAFQLVGKNDEAIEDFTRFILERPKCANAYFRRAFCYKALNMMDEAASDFETATRLEPTNPHLVVNYSRISALDVIVLCPPGEEPRTEGDAER